jgi:hypothetical protein
MKNQRLLIFGLCAVLALVAARAPAQDVRRDPYRIARKVPATTVYDYLGRSVGSALPARIAISSPGAADWVRLKGDFGPAGQSVLAFRLAAGASQEKDKTVTRR